MAEFDNDWVFVSRDEMMEWVQTTARNLGYMIVTQRTKKNVLDILKKVYLQCDRSGEYKSASKSKTNFGIYLRFLNYTVVPIFLIMISLFRN